MRLKLSLCALPFLFALNGCFEDSGSSDPHIPSQKLTDLSGWADTAKIVLPGDSNLATGTLANRWDSVVNLSKYSAEVRADLQSIAADWSSRAPVSNSWTVVKTATDAEGKTLLVKFSVEGVIQGGLVRIPNSTGPLPVLLFGHPSDGGVNPLHFKILDALLGELEGKVIVVAPAFRGETANLDDTFVTSDSTRQSPWDRDVDDAIAMLGASLDNISNADPSRIAAVGYSRGAGVVLLAALRDNRIHAVAEIAGPTDFFAPSLQNVALGLAAGKSYNLPGLDFLDSRYLQPFKNGTISADSLRRVLLRRSAARFALSGMLPPTLAIHGDLDTTVYPDQSEALDAADPKVRYTIVTSMTHSSFVSQILFDGNYMQAKAISSSLVPFLKEHL